jgi:hypothetical protein
MKKKWPLETRSARSARIPDCGRARADSSIAY